ncbi:MAG: extensin-like domain-containing protein [Alphaproteobacteria bacterium]
MAIKFRFAMVLALLWVGDAAAQTPLQTPAPACAASVGENSALYDPADPIPLVEGCGAALVVTLMQFGLSGVAVRPAATTTCPMVAGLARWMDEVVQPAAAKHLNETVLSVRNVSSYVCRNRNGAKTGKRSEHAVANALDVAGFHLGSGRWVMVESGWAAMAPDGQTGAAQSDFMKEVHRGACKIFQTVLGPDANAAHRDHFHLDLGANGICR